MTVGPKFPESPNTATRSSILEQSQGGKRLTDKRVLSAGDPGYLEKHISLCDGYPASEDHCRVQLSTYGQSTRPGQHTWKGGVPLTEE